MDFPDFFFHVLTEVIGFKNTIERSSAFLVTSDREVCDNNMTYTGDVNLDHWLKWVCQVSPLSSYYGSFPDQNLGAGMLLLLVCH